MADALPPAPEGNPAAAMRKQRTTGATVTIACKLPTGLLVELWDMDPAKAMSVPDGNGGTRFIRPRIPYSEGEERLLIRGSAAERRLETVDEKGRPTPPPALETVASGFGLTFGVDADWAEAWFKQNADYPPVRRGLIFMQKSAASARDQAKDHANLLTGFEALNPHKPAPGIEPDSERHPGLAA